MLHHETIGGSNTNHRVRGIRIERVTNHHTGPGPAIRVAYTDHPRDNRAGTGDFLECKMELIGGARDTGTAGGHGIGADRAFGEAAHVCRIAPEPQRHCSNSLYRPVVSALQISDVSYSL